MGESSGEYRQNSIYIGGIHSPSWELVGPLMSQLINWIESSSK